jgi:hypothetical protein
MVQRFEKPGRSAPSEKARPSEPFRNASSSKGITYLQAAFARAFRASTMLRSKAVTAGQIAEYLTWQDEALAARPPLHDQREQLWAALAARIEPGSRLVVLEFGVAWGYATDWWLRHLAQAGVDDLSWHGFDRFTGLPRAWRDHTAGTYDAGGEPPAIDDPRIEWHVGDISDTLPSVDLEAARDARWLVLFDLDLFEPTAEAWKVLSPHLREGDLIYFDEAMDDDERRVLDELVLPSGSFEPVGTTALALGLRVRQR